MKRYVSAPTKPVFTPNDVLNGYAMGINFSAYGKVFLYVGKVGLHDREIDAIAISDFSKNRFLKSVAKHEMHPVSLSAFVEVDDSNLHVMKGAVPSYVLCDPDAILNLLYQVELSSSKADLPEVFQELMNSLSKASCRMLS